MGFPVCASQMRTVRSEDAEMMRQLLGKSTSGYNAIIQDLNNTKVGLDDDDYDY